MPNRTPEEVIAELAPAYQEWKGGEKSKNTLKDEFFEAITEQLTASGEAPEDLMIVNGVQTQDEAIRTAEKSRPGWLVEELRPLDGADDAWEVIVVQDPAFMPFTISYEGQVWGRQVAEGPTMLDDDRLEAENPELWLKVSEYPHRKLVEDVAYESGKDPSECEFDHEGFRDGWDGFIDWQLERHGYERALKPMDEIDDDLLPELQKYVYIGQPTIKLPAPKKVKE